jgi:hypothetical protein
LTSNEIFSLWGYNCCFFLNFVPLHIESPYNFGGKKPSAEDNWACRKMLTIANEKISFEVKFVQRCVYIKYVIGWENLLKAVVMNEVYSN